MKKVWIAFSSLLLLMGCTVKEENIDDKKVTEVEETEKKDDIRDVSFVAVGDNLIHGAIYYYNAVGDGTYDFTYMYEATNYLTQDADISYLNQETICGGRELGLSHYPSFNGPYEVLDGAASAGFNWMATSSNHSMDAGVQGI